MPASKVRVVLALLKELGVVAETRGTRFKLVKAGLRAEELEAISKEYSTRTDTDRAKLDRMMMYAQTARCRWKVLLDYFGMTMDFENCGHCDNCRNPVSQRIQPPAPQTVSPILPRETAADAPRRGRKALAPGDLVQVREHGRAEVVGVEGDNVDVRFANGEVRKFKRAFLRRAAA